MSVSLNVPSRAKASQNASTKAVILVRFIVSDDGEL